MVAALQAAPLMTPEEKAIGKKLEVNYLPVRSQNRFALVLIGTVELEFGTTTNTRRTRPVSRSP